MIALPGRFAAVVSDLDGLLVQTEVLWTEAKVTLFGRYGATFHREDQLAVFGTAEAYTAQVFRRRLGLPEGREEALRAEYSQIVTDLFSAGPPVAPGARELLAALRGRIPLALASNTRGPLVERILWSVGMRDAFDAIVTGDEGTPKPAPDLYLLACRRLGVRPEDALALEDSPTGVAAAKAAGLTVVGVPSTPEIPLPDADLVLGSLTELLAAVEPLPHEAHPGRSLVADPGPAGSPA